MIFYVNIYEVKDTIFSDGKVGGYSVSEGAFQQTMASLHKDRPECYLTKKKERKGNKTKNKYE